LSHILSVWIGVVQQILDFCSHEAIIEFFSIKTQQDWRGEFSFCCHRTANTGPKGKVTAQQQDASFSVRPEQRE
jgi:hypothetical protein